MKRFALPVGVSLAAFALLLQADEAKKVDVSKLPPAAKGPVDFAKDVGPILAKACVSCHGAVKSKGGFRMDCGGEFAKGSNSGPVIKPGDSAASRLIHLVGGLDAETKMPPSGKTPLTAAEIGTLRAWIDGGAKWPQDLVLTSPDDAKPKHWAFQPIQKPAVPAVANRGWVRNPIDAFILARLEKEKIAPSPEADRPTLIRRLSFDLLGLPPTLAEVDAFLADSSPDAYEKLVDRLLASPHYGERWGRHWLDLARYADSDGYEKDTGRPFAWRYRHWVINAFNRDLPFDQFTIEQLAGDLLPNPTVDQKIATGFHRNTLTNKEGGVDQEQFRVEACVDRVNTTGKVFLGITVGCAQCHDHKYDPFSQREYYQFFAFFNSDTETDITAPLPGEEDVYAKKKAEHDKKLAELQGAVKAYEKELPAKVSKLEADLRGLTRLVLPPAVPFAEAAAPPARTAKQQQELLARLAKTEPKLMALQKAANDHAKTAPQLGKAMTLALGAKRKTQVMIRGDFLRPGVEVLHGTPAVLHPIKTHGPQSVGLTRLDLARWIVDPTNPLTARVTANWMWGKYLGRSLVATPEDFGTQGEKPSNPELLDYLASEVMLPSPLGRGVGGEGKPEGAWSLKRMHKLIVTSATYRQSSAYRPDLKDRDALNILLARQNRLRLESEIIRDNALAASGLLTRTIGGPSVRPPQPAGISELTYAGSARWVESTGADRYRRGMYTWFQRTSPYPMLMTFDQPDGNVCVVRRDRTNTPLQALTLLNDIVFVECFQALGKRIVDDKPNAEVAERLRHAFRLCLGREPSAGELDRVGKLFASLVQSARSNPEAAAKLVGKMKPSGVDLPEAAAWVALGRALLNLDEFVTRE